MVQTRRATTRDERLTPCECCGFPLSHRHHMLDVASHGENDCTAQLCGTCHDLFHVMENSYSFGNRKARRLVDELVLLLGRKNQRLQRVQSLVMEAKKLRCANIRAICEAADPL